MLSMTGYGEAQRAHSWKATSIQVRAEVRTVNHKALDVRVRVPSGPGALQLEQVIGKQVASRLRRGAVQVFVYCTKAGHSVHGDETELRRRYELAAQVARDTGESLATIAALLPPSGSNNGDDSDTASMVADLSETIRVVVDEALTQVLESRAKEAEQLRIDIAARSELLVALHGQISQSASGQVERSSQRLRDKLAQAQVEVPEERLAAEIVLLTDRNDIAEELVRAQAHLAQLSEILTVATVLGDVAPVGRRLDVLLQEILREFSTMGAKSTEVEIISRVMSAKLELERIREQVQNVE